MTVEVLLFAAAREIAGDGRIRVELAAGQTVADLREAILREQPGLRPVLASSRFAVGHDFVDDTCVIGEHSEIAVIPPVSGG